MTAALTGHITGQAGPGPKSSPPHFERMCERRC
jgi:hypothetical protein